MLDCAESHTFGALLRQHRLAAGLTQAVLAERSGIGERTLQDLERGAARPRQATVHRLEVALGLLPTVRASEALSLGSPASVRARSVSPTPTGRDVNSIRGQSDDRVRCVRRHWVSPPNNLPVQPTALLGRERELAEISALLRDGTRLVTLTGPGGVGKTRLSAKVAATLLDQPGISAPGQSTAKGRAFGDGVFLIELAPLSDPSFVAASIAQVLGVPDRGGRTLLDDLKQYLRTRSLLLLLDNFEHIVAAAPLVAELLAWCPDLSVLVTSREPLRVRGEREYDVGTLALPGRHGRPPPSKLTQSPAVALFVERAAAIRPGFTVTEENGGAIAEVCTRLDGLPLAIELAAGRVRALTPVSMAAWLERRLPLLTGGARDLPGRQQTLRATIDWSHDLLDDDDRRLFRRLAVFVGGWTLDAVEAVCTLDDLDLDVPHILESLFSKSLIRESSDSDGQPRLGLLETIREYGLERLGDSGEAPRIRRRHAEFFLALAERASRVFGCRAGPVAEPPGGRARQSPGGIAVDHAGGRCAARSPARRSPGALLGDSRPSGPGTPLSLTRVLSLTGTRAYPASRARVLDNFGYLAFSRGDHAAARACYEECLAIARDLGNRGGEASAMAGLAWVALEVGDFSTSRALQEQSLAIMRDVVDWRGTAVALNGLGYSLGYVARDLEEYAVARACHEESLAIARDLGHRRGVVRASTGLARIAFQVGDFSTSRTLLEQSLAIARDLGDPHSAALALHGLGSVASVLGNHDEARAYHEESLAIMRGLGNRRWMARSLAQLGSGGIRQGDHARAQALLAESLAIIRELGEALWSIFSLEVAVDLDLALERVGRAARLQGAIDALRERVGVPLSPRERGGYEANVATMRAALGEPGFAAASVAGRAMTLEQAVDFALETAHTPRA